jgi:hypothetical protein
MMEEDKERSEVEVVRKVEEGWKQTRWANEPRSWIKWGEEPKPLPHRPPFH